MTVQKPSRPEQDQNRRSEPTNLVRRYGQIGIAALTAVLQYSTKKPPQAPSPTRIDERFSERAA